MTSNSTDNLPEIPPLQGISESERDKYLLIGTFLSVLIIFGIIVAFMHRKCRETIVKTKTWIVTKTAHHRHRPTYDRSISNTSRAREVSLRHPSSPVFCKEVNAPVLFFLGSSDETTSSDRSKISKRPRSAGCDNQNGEISIISSQNIPLCTLPVPKNKFAINKDVNDNFSTTHNFENTSFMSDTNLIRVLPPEIPEETKTTSNQETKKTSNQKTKTTSNQRPKLRRSSTVVDKMNFMNGYLPSSRDDDYTVITLTDESGSECHAQNLRNKKFGSVNGGKIDHNLLSEIENIRDLKGIDNPSFEIGDQSRLYSQSDFNVYAVDEVPNAHVPGFSRQKQMDFRNEIPNYRTKLYRSSCEVQIHSSEKGNVKDVFVKPFKYKTYKHPMYSKETNKIIDKESQELYRRIVREKIQDIIQSDTSSVASDRSSVRPGRKKKQKLSSNFK